MVASDANPTHRPVVGIAATVRPLDLRFVTLPGHTVLDSYIRGVEAAGGLPVLLPVVDPSLAARMVAAVDALVLTGGVDVDPAAYGAGPGTTDPADGPPDPGRDAFELALVEAAGRTRTPLLGVCRGLHVINVARGGTLTAHVDGHRDFALRHPIEVTPGSLLDGIVGPSLETGSLHHQAVDRLGGGVLATATAPDGTIEAIEAGCGAPVLGVQWHPEMEAGPAGAPLFRWLIEAAAERASA